MLYEVKRDEKDLENAKKTCRLVNSTSNSRKNIFHGEPLLMEIWEKNIWFKYFIICCECLVGEGFHRLYTITKEKKYLDILKSIGNN